MGFSEHLSKRIRSDGDGRRSTGSVTNRLEDRAKTVRELSTAARNAAGKRAGDVADRGVDALRERSSGDTVDDLRERLVESDPTALSDRLRERLLDECCERLVGASLAECRERAERAERAERDGAPTDEDAATGTIDPIDRAVENFLRRYDLQEARLDEATIETIRTRVAAEFDADPDRILDRLLDGDAASAGSPAATRDAADRDGGSGGSEDPAAALAALGSQFCDDLELDPDLDDEQSIPEILSAIGQRDAVVVGHAVESVIEEVPDVLGAQSAPESSPRPDDRDTTEIPIRGIGSGADDRTAFSIQRAAVAAAVMGLLANEDVSVPTSGVSGGDGSLFQVLPILATVLTDATDAAGADGGSVAFDQLVDAVLASGLLETDGGLDFAALTPGSTESEGSLALVGLFVANLVAMTAGAWLSRKKAPPIPAEIRGANGETVVTADQVRLGKKAFQANGFMNQGSVLGNGSYFGVDLTADALELKAAYMRDYYARRGGAGAFEDLSDAEQAAVAERVEQELDADAPEGSIAEYSAAEVYAHHQIREEYVDRYYGGSPERGIPSGFARTAEQAARVADFACWTAWMAHTNRPGSEHSYTNDWPYVPGTGNRPTGQVLVWSTISVVLLVAGGDAGVWAYHAFDFAEPATELVDVPSPDEVSITPTQYAAGWYVPVAGALFVAQALVGAYLAHYYVERTGFYGIGDALGIDLVSLLPFSVGRTWHINLGVLWITTLWLAGGLFLPGLFADSDPPWQAESATALLGVLVATTVGAFAGVWLSSQGAFSSPADGDLWWWLGSEGLEYLEVGRFWKLLLLTGFVSWTGLVLRSVRRLDEPPTGLGHFMAYAGGSIALMFAASMLYTPETNMAVTEFWRWWVVHMWVEGVFEFFVTAVVSVALVSMDLLDKGAAEQAIFFEVFTIMAAGIVGVSHHYWWVGLPDVWVPIGTTFSTLEFVPLVFVLYRSFGEYRSLKAQGEDFPYTLPLLFIVGSSVWNFVGGGVLGFFINLPLINYYEHGTYLTVAHGHTATFGAFGLLALGLGTYILRVLTPEDAWDPTWFRGAFWLTNIGLTVMTVASLLPVGFLQLQTSYQDGYAAARSVAFYEQDHVQTLLWARTLGDTPMILGALAFTAAAVRHLWAARGRAVEQRSTGSETETGGLLPG